MSSTPDNQQRRIERLEEAIQYSDRTVEILSGEITQLNKTVLGLTRRVAQIEARLSEINNRVSEDVPNVPPPHSAGPDIPRDPL